MKIYLAGNTPDRERGTSTNPKRIIKVPISLLSLCINR